MAADKIEVGQKALVNIEIKAIYGENAHILVGGKIIAIPVSELKLS